MADTNRQLVIIGGAEDKQGDCTVLREFVRRAGGVNSRIVVMTVATELPREVGDDYLRVFERLGVEEVRIIDTVERDDASSSTYLEAIEKATGVFFTGGNQARITSVLKDTEIDRLLHKRLGEGIVIGGTSAGAAMMPDMMIVEGDSETNPRIEIVKMEPGMAFLPGVVIDQHFAQRGRIGRLLSAVTQQPVSLGFGIDENTAVVVTISLKWLGKALLQLSMSQGLLIPTWIKFSRMRTWHFATLSFISCLTATDLTSPREDPLLTETFSQRIQQRSNLIRCP